MGENEGGDMPPGLPTRGSLPLWPPERAGAVGVKWERESQERFAGGVGVEGFWVRETPQW